MERVVTMKRSLLKLALAGAVGLLLSGCVYEGAPYGYPTYAPAYPAYYGPSVVVGYGGGGYYRHWR
jgi:hypothetical protein